MGMIEITTWAGESKAGVKFFSNTPGDQRLALEYAEDYVLGNWQRSAHITLTGSNYGIYIVRYNDDERMPIFNERLDLLRENLAKQERGFADAN